MTDEDAEALDAVAGSVAELDARIDGITDLTPRERRFFLVL